MVVIMLYSCYCSNWPQCLFDQRALTSSPQPMRRRTPNQQKPRPNSLRGLLQRQARRRKLQEVESQLEEADLRRMVQLLEEQAEAAAGDGQLRINYDGFAQVGGLCIGG